MGVRAEVSSHKTLQRIRIAVDEEDLRAGREKASCAGQSDSGGRARYGGDFAC
jgi:hypothetical protein